MATDLQATVDDLYEIQGKAELVEGRIVEMSPTGDLPSSAAGEIYASLRIHARQFGGRAYTDNAAFIVNLPGRKSFSPDVAYYVGPRSRMKFLQGAPIFAVEVRSDGDYGPAAEKRLANKRADYFAAGTKVVWDVDVIGDEPIRAYRADLTDAPQVFRCGETAHAEPAVPGWTFLVDELYD